MYHGEWQAEHQAADGQAVGPEEDDAALEKQGQAGRLAGTKGLRGVCVWGGEGARQGGACGEGQRGGGGRGRRGGGGEQGGRGRPEGAFGAGRRPCLYQSPAVQWGANVGEGGG